MGCSKSTSSPSFSAISVCIRCSICFTLACIFLVFEPIYARVLMLRSFSFMGSKPILLFSLFSDQLRTLFAASLSLLISFLCFSFSATAKLSFFSLFSHQEEKLPACTSMVLRFSTSTWSTQASSKSLSWETRIKPFFDARYCFTIFRLLSSRWLVGSSISRKSFSPENRIANITLVCSPKLSVFHGRYMISASACSFESSA